MRVTKKRTSYIIYELCRSILYKVLKCFLLQQPALIMRSQALDSATKALANLQPRPIVGVTVVRQLFP